MDGSNSSGGKKIVFKKRLLAAKDPFEDLLPEPLSEIKQEPVVDSAPDHQYQGEVFDQFYRPLSVEGGLGRLITIAQSEQSVLTPPERLSKQEIEARGQKEQELAEALAHQIYQLAQKDRETAIDIYLSAFNVVLADKTPQEAKRILDRTNEFFTEHYYTAIRERGERPEIYYQILKRVGHDASDRISKIVFGLDIEAVAESLWNLYHGGHADKHSRITDILLDCTERQVLAVREEFLLIPYKHLAKQAHSVLKPASSNSTPTARRSIGKTEVYEQKKSVAYKARDDMRALRYLFLGRSSEEMALIRRFYCDFGDVDAAESEIGLEAHVRRNLSQAEFDRVAMLLAGWSPYQEAVEFNEIIFPRTLGDEIEDQLSDPRDMVDRDHTQGIGPFLRRFKKRRVWRGHGSVHHRIVNQFELLVERVSALSLERFLASNEALREMYGYELDPTLFPSLRLFDARRVAETLHARMPVAFDFFEIIQPMQFLEPRQCLAVQQAYEVLYGTTLRETIQERLLSAQVKMPAAELQVLVDRYVNGHGRWPLNVDVLGRYRGDEPEPGVWQHDFKTGEKHENLAIKLAEIMDQDINVGELDRSIRETLFEYSYDELNKIERAFYELTDPKMPLRRALENLLSPEAFQSVELLLGGVDLPSIITHLRDDPNMVLTLQDVPPHYVSAIREAFERKYFVAIEEFLTQHLSRPDQETDLIDRLSIMLAPEVFDARKLLHRLRKDSTQELEVLRGAWSGGLVRTMAFERAFDSHFPRLRVHLKLLAARMVISPIVFAEIVLCLEGIDPEINQRILECFDAVDISSLLTILRSHKRDQRIIEETYDLLNPDSPLRRSISEMKVDLDIINETLLHLEGYSAKDVAEELFEILSSSRGEEVGPLVLDVLAIPSSQRPNQRIPEDINWMDEMFFQVALAYHREYRADLIDSCRRAGVSHSSLEELTSRVFGIEVCASARDLFTLLKMNKEGAVAPDYSEQRICSYLESRGARHRDRLVRAYNSFWAHTPGYNSLIDDITKFFKDTMVKKKMLSLLLGVGGDNKTATINPVILH